MSTDGNSDSGLTPEFQDHTPDSEPAVDSALGMGNEAVENIFTQAADAVAPPPDQQQQQPPQSGGAELSPADYALGGQFGMTVEQVQSFGSPEALRTALTMVQQRDQQWGEHFQQQQPQGGQQQAPQGQQQTLPEFEYEPVNLDFEEEFPGMSAMMNEQLNAYLKPRAEQQFQQQQAYEQYFAQMNQQLQQVHGYLQQQQATQYQEQLAGMVDQLPQEAADIFGNVRQLSPGTPQHTATVELVNFMNALGQTKPNATGRELFDAAVRALHPDKLNGQARSPAPTPAANGTPPRDNRGRFTSRPTSRAAVDTRDGNERAMAVAEQFDRVMGNDDSDLDSGAY